MNLRGGGLREDARLLVRQEFNDEQSGERAARPSRRGRERMSAEDHGFIFVAMALGIRSIIEVRGDVAKNQGRA